MRPFPHRPIETDDFLSTPTFKRHATLFGVSSACGFLVSRFQTMAFPHLLLALDTYCFSPSPLRLFHVPSQYYMSDVRSKYHNLFFTHGPDEQKTEVSGGSQ